MSAALQIDTGNLLAFPGSASNECLACSEFLARRALMGDCLPASHGIEFEQTSHRSEKKEAGAGIL